MAIQAVFNDLQRSLGHYPLKAPGTFIILASIVFIAVICLYRILFHPLRHVPGPFIAKFTGLWRSHKYLRGTWHEDALEIHRKWGRVVRIAPNEVSVVDEYAMKQLYGHKHNQPKTKWYSVWDPPPGKQIFSTLDKDEHAFMRKRVSGAFSMSSVLKYESYIQDLLDLMMEKLYNYAVSGQVINMSNWTNALAFDVVGELGYGSPLGHLKTETDVDNLRKTIFGMFQIMANMGYVPGQMWWIHQLGKLSGSNPFSSFTQWSTSRIQQRMDKLDAVGREDLLGHFCQMKDREGNPVRFEEILVECLNLIGAGADTTSIGMRTTLYYVGKYPDTYKKLRSEIDAFYEENNLGNTPVTYLQTQKLPYACAVIKEATRLLPSIVFQLPRYAPENFVVRDIYIPPNTEIGISPISQNRDRDIWGHDADEFRPERWLEDPDRANYLDACNMTFGGNGPRMCIGKNIALVELHKFLVQFMRNFDFEFSNENQPWKITTYWFAYQHDFNIRMKPRERIVPRKSR